MSKRQQMPTAIRRASDPGTGFIRLDRIENPYGPSVAVYEALNTAHLLDGRDGLHNQIQLRGVLAAMLGVPRSWLLLANGIDELLQAIYLSRRDLGPLVYFPPTDPDQERRANILRVPLVPLQRTSSFTLALDLETVSDLTSPCWAVVQSPNDPTGTVLEPQDAVRLARACELLVIDERHGAYAGRSFLPLMREFSNIVILQTMETWAGLSNFPVAYAIALPSVLEHVASFLMRDALSGASIVAGLATMSDLRHVKSTLHWVRQERSRLFRTLRKLNMVSPRPSWANFLPARVERGDAVTLAEGLAARGILVHRPPQAELGAILRISAGRPEETDALTRALIDLGLEL